MPCPMPVETGTSASSASCHRRGERSEAVGDVCEDHPRLGVLVIAQLAAALAAAAPEEATNVEQLEAAVPLTT